MSQGQYLFGWLREPLQLHDAVFAIKPQPSFEDRKREVEAAFPLGSAWIVPPNGYGTFDGVEVPSERYELSKTHTLATNGRSYDKAYGQFIILVLGFVLGLRLTIEGDGHLYATPWKQGSLVSFVPKGSEILRCLHAATTFWDSAGPDIRKMMFAAIHWYLTAQSYRHQFEKFVWQYAVIDNIHRITWNATPTYRKCCPNERGNHSQRPGCLAAEYGSPLPACFADSEKGNGDAGRLITLRNELIHEARWVGEPLGYAVGTDAHEIIEHLKYFNSQLILGVLGIACKFRSLTYPYQTQALDLI
ncbi:MAG: hypothetical protein HY246_08060 [Proteobacteria bacterium]|nr:hypothetical protein [Pseudomonadota bacterium]